MRTSVWNQRGYDLAFKFCSCDCGHGHLKKNEVEEAKESKEEKKRKKEKTSQLPKLNVGDKGKVSDVKDFSEKFGRDKRIGDGPIPSKSSTVYSVLNLPMSELPKFLAKTVKCISGCLIPFPMEFPVCIDKKHNFVVLSDVVISSG